MLKSCIIGYGNIAVSHKKGYDKLLDVSVVAACDIRPERRELAISHGLRAYESVEEMLEKESPDFVDICLPTYLHADFAVKAMEKGINVICEKPFTTTVEKSAEILVKMLSMRPDKLQTITTKNFRDLAVDFKVTLPEKFLYEK